MNFKTKAITMVFATACFTVSFYLLGVGVVELKKAVTK